MNLSSGVPWDNSWSVTMHSVWKREIMKNRKQKNGKVEGYIEYQKKLKPEEKGFLEY